MQIILTKEIKSLLSRIMIHLDHTYQKLIARLQTMQKILVLLCRCDNIIFLENRKQGCKRTISWNKHRSQITTQAKNNNLDYLIDPTFRNINRLFVLSFKNGDNGLTRNSFDEHYMQLIDINEINRNQILMHNWQQAIFWSVSKKQTRSV